MSGIISCVLVIVHILVAITADRPNVGADQ